MLVPSFWQGADLAKLTLWAPDVGHAAVAVAGLSAVLALARVAVAVHALVAPAGPARPPGERRR